mgnify:CR=1 FL=1
MNVETAREYSLSKKAATEDMPFGDDFLTIRVMEKMFLCISFNTPDRITMKCDPDYAIELRDHYNGVEGAWHFNKKYWNTIYLDRDMPDSEIKHWIHHSYREVIAKLPKKIREAYENE